jgi:hypothetical protein
MNENTTGAPLTATVGERLGEKAHLEQLRERARPEASVGEEAEERQPRPRRRAAGRGSRWLPLVAAAIGWALVRNVTHGVGRRMTRARSSLLRRWR